MLTEFTSCSNNEGYLHMVLETKLSLLRTLKCVKRLSRGRIELDNSKLPTGHKQLKGRWLKKLCHKDKEKM